MSPILRHFPQDKGGVLQKNAINWGFFHIYAKKPVKSGISWPPKTGQKQAGRVRDAHAAWFTKLLCARG
jgi:hypothetical protein